MKQENVNHPSHYNQHPAGIECIDIIRHYTCDIANAIKYLWRAGLKTEMGKEDAEKEMEDLHKALWYIEDFNKMFKPTQQQLSLIETMKKRIKTVTGHAIEEITTGYDDNVKIAMACLLLVGLIVRDKVSCDELWYKDLQTAIRCIQKRILEINMKLTLKEVDEMEMALKGIAIEGEDYAKPGGIRDTEPDNYDPLNVVILYGRAYCLTNEIRQKPNGALYTPCNNCDLQELCYKDWKHPKEEECRHLCQLHYAATEQYYREVGYAKYSPRYGTIEIIDKKKEREKEMKEMEEEDEENE